tara:strand:+ start:94 stop:705 length:612 start_codon:yes stop_codon:yes gene_type:complete
MITQKIYDHDFVNPKPHVFHKSPAHARIAVVTPPKNASSLINYFWGDMDGKPTWEEGYDKCIAIKRDPVDRWVATVNMMKWRIASRFPEMTDDIEFWNRDPNDLAKLHNDYHGLFFEISEFCPQSLWIKDINHVDKYYVDDIDEIVSPMIGIPVQKEGPNAFWRNESKSRKDKINLIDVDDLTVKSKQIIMDLYKVDYENGWC